MVTTIHFYHLSTYNMGRSEWGFTVTSQAEYDQVIAFITKHNEECPSEPLSIDAIIKYKDPSGEEEPPIDDDDARIIQMYVCASNGGGRDITSAFIKQHYTADGEVYFPFDKPWWWHTDFVYVWQSSADSPSPPYLLF